MTGNLSQIVALVAYGNDFLNSSNIPTDFNTANTAFQFTKAIDFRELRKACFFTKPKEIVIASNPTDWFQYLKKDGCKNLRLYFEHSSDESFAKDHKLAGLVGGGGLWLIEAVYDTYSNLWSYRWEVSDQNAIDGKIWTVNYGLIKAKQETIYIQNNIQNIKEKLRNTLTDIAHFAFSQNLPNWGELFEKARHTLESRTPGSNYFNNDLLPLDKYSLSARQLLYAAGQAFVFGGMGSWNDLGFEKNEDNETYDRLSEQLYSNIIDAIIAGTNSH